jgi:hypothetical protein
MKTRVVKSFMRVLVFLLVLGLTVSGAWAATANTFILSDEGAGLINRLVNAGYGEFNLYQSLVAIQTDTDPSVAGIITYQFLMTLAGCPVNSPIFTTQLKNIPAGSSVAISTDCTAQVAASGWFGSNFRSGHGESYYNQPGNTTLQATIGGFPGTGLFTHPTNSQNFLTAFSANGNTYNVFAIGWESNGSQSFVLSDEGTGLITRLVTAGYGAYNLYQTLVAIQQSSDPSVSPILTDVFLATLNSLPDSSVIFTAPLNSYSAGSALAISTDGTVQSVNIHGFTYYNQSGNTTLSATISGVPGTGLFTHSTNSQNFLTTFSANGNTYKVFAIGWKTGQLIYLPIIIR